jgi:hypothetical protein
MLYLRKMKGQCINCLARDHNVASCRDPTRCWHCRRFGHTSRECLSSNSVQLLNSRPYLIPGAASSPPHIARDVDAMVDDSLLIEHSTPSTTYERMMDLMLLEAHLMNQRPDMEGDSSIPPLANLTPHVINHHHSTEDILTPALSRSEAEQLVGHELIKALRDFK